MNLDEKIISGIIDGEIRIGGRGLELVDKIWGHGGRLGFFFEAFSQFW